MIIQIINFKKKSAVYTSWVPYYWMFLVRGVKGLVIQTNNDLIVSVFIIIFVYNFEYE
jgi:hypothetical protein